MTTRIMSNAVLTHKNKVLLIKRGLHKALAPGLWASIGGHLELSDITNPRQLDLLHTCFREVEEETRIHYFYFGQLDTLPALPPCDEGELHWIEKSQIPKLPMAPSAQEVFKHWCRHSEDGKRYMVVVNPAEDGSTVIELGEE